VPIVIDRIDHLVLTVADVERTLAFYSRVLGMEPVTFAGGRRALAFGRQKLNLHQAGREYEPKALKPVPGAIDLCFIASTPLEEVIAVLKREGVVVIEGPVAKTGALGPMMSVYFRDPDGNLVEVSNYDAP
jgi:catechol 2,3-dioxygenase-like lactoylglutathione lyase family enzyme